MKMKQYIASHRCQSLLQYNEDHLPVFIRYGWRYDFSWNVKTEKQGWHLYRVYEDTDYDSIYPQYVTTIKYCPFCGEELKDELSE